LIKGEIEYECGGVAHMWSERGWVVPCDCSVAALVLARNGIGGDGGGGGGDVMEGWAAIGRVLSQSVRLQTLTQLDVSGNTLGPEGLAVLAKGVAASHTLQILSLDHNSLVGRHGALLSTP